MNMYSNTDDNSTQRNTAFPPQVYTMRHVPFPYLFVNVARKIQMANAFAVRMAGYSLTELVNQPLALLIDAYAVDQLVMMRATQPDEAFAIMTTVCTKEGDEMDAELRVTIDYQDGYGIRGYHLFVHPVETRTAHPDASVAATQQYYNEQLNQQSALMNELIDALKTPISTLNTSAYLIERKQDSDERQKYTQMLQSRVNHISELLQDVNDYHHISQHNPTLDGQAVSINAVLADTVGLLRHRIEENGLRFHQQLPVIPVSIMGNQALLIRLFSTILQNAIDYTETGTISLTTYVDYERNLLHVMVQDTGCGIPEQDIANVCDRFYRAQNAHAVHPNGGGMGLAIATKIVDQHHGTLTIESRVEQGTSVIITLPLSNA